MAPPAKPRVRPCASCPYRRDVPPGIWEPTEYAKLPAYDRDTASQPLALFGCHQNDGTVCAGWLGCHGGGDLLAVRIAVTQGRADPSCYTYTTDVPLHPSGAAAATHGTRQPDEELPPETLAAIRKVVAKRAAGGRR